MNTRQLSVLHGALIEKIDENLSVLNAARVSAQLLGGRQLRIQKQETNYEAEAELWEAIESGPTETTGRCADCIS